MTNEEYAAAWAALLAAGDKELLRREYIDLIGYDPFEDDPVMTADDVKQLLADYKRDVAIYGRDDDAGFTGAQSLSDFYLED